MKKVALVLGLLIVSVLMVGVVLAHHNGAVVSYEVLECGQTNFSATITDPNGTHKVGNMYLVVDADGTTQYVNVPTNGNVAQITAGPFYQDTLISWNVFGGGERTYDQPLWNGFGSATFNADVASYADAVGTFNWVVAGPDDPNPFVNWNEFMVEGCPLTKDQCKDDGWQALGFSNQGECIQYVNTGQE